MYKIFRPTSSSRNLWRVSEDEWVDKEKLSLKNSGDKLEKSGTSEIWGNLVYDWFSVFNFLIFPRVLFEKNTLFLRLQIK